MFEDIITQEEIDFVRALLRFLSEQQAFIGVDSEQEDIMCHIDGHWLSLSPNKPYDSDVPPISFTVHSTRQTEEVSERYGRQYFGDRLGTTVVNPNPNVMVFPGRDRPIFRIESLVIIDKVTHTLHCWAGRVTDNSSVPQEKRSVVIGEVND